MENSDGDISYFRISGESPIKENSHDSRSSDDIDTKLRLVSKRDSRNKTTFDNYVMLTNFDVIFVFLSHGQFGAIQKLDSGRIVCKTKIFINDNF